ncbi:zinc finger protein 473 homolog [Saccostrea echinata]|uniref:zinc finger protein 473 homolog n=1 Tax=Saccostrea echinata TaxID=191078 RepID=UPI002A7F4BA0|nr:zinc finger protein 473 homolog [Saccostrea echinata]
MDTNQCQVCGNFFITLTSLNNHIETHSKKELYHCILGLRNTIAMLSRQPLPEATYQETVNVTATDLSQNHHAHNTSPPEKTVTMVTNPASASSYEIHTSAESSQPGLMHPKPAASIENTIPITPPHQVLVNSEPHAHSEPHATESGSHQTTENLQSAAALNNVTDSGNVGPSEGDMLTCPICKKKLTSSYTLYRHMQSHYDKQADTCQVCGKEFVGKRSLVVHMRTHTGERPYKCNTCGKQFAQYGTLYRHRQIHNKGENANNQTPATPVPAESAQAEDPASQKHLQQGSANQKHLQQSPANQKHVQNSVPATVGSESDQVSSENRLERVPMVTENRDVSEVPRAPEKTTILSVPSTEHMSHDQQELGESSGYPNPPHVSDTEAINNLLYQHVFGDQQQFLQGYLQNQLFAQTLARFPNWGSEFALMAGYPGYAGLDYKKPETDQNYDMSVLPNPQVEKTRADTSTDQLQETFSDNSVTSSKSERLESFSSLTESLLRRRNQSPVVTTVNSAVGPGIPATQTLADPSTSAYPSPLGIHPPPPPSYEAAVQQSLGSPALLNTPVVENDQSQSSTSTAVNMTLEVSCKVCAQKFQTSAELTKHMSQHSEKNFVWCQICHSKFTTPFSLRRHMKIHTGERDEVCGVCGKRFIDKPRLVVHMRTHTGEKPYACSICPKTFSRREVLKRHEKTHTTFKPLETSTPKHIYEDIPRKQEVEVRKEPEHSQMDSGMYLSFDEDKVAMMTYLPSDHPENTTAISEPEPEKPVEEARYMYTADDIKSDTPPGSDVTYQHEDIPIMPQQEEVAAEVSDTENSSPKAIENNQEVSTDVPSDSGSGKDAEVDRDSRTMNEINDMLMRNFTSKVDGAKPYQCDVCNRKYTMQSCLRRHMLVHTGLKPNRCQVCGKSFVEKQQLLVHFRIHTGERPHQCSVCGKRFTQYGTLHNHMQVHRKQQLSQAMNVGSKGEEELSEFMIKREISEEDEFPKQSQELVNGEAVPSEIESAIIGRENQSDGPVIKSPYVSDESRSLDISNKMRPNVATLEDSQETASVTGDEDRENSKEEVSPGAENVGGQVEDTDTSEGNEKPEGTGGGSKSERPAYDFLYGYPTTSLMSLNLLANTSEVHQSLMEHMAQIQRAPEMHQSLLEYMAQLQRARMVGLTDYNTAFTRPPVSCTYTSSSDVGLNLTTSESHTKDIGLNCDMCDAKFTDQETLDSHMKTHALKNGNDTMLSQATEATSPTKSDKFHTCKTCGKSFSASFCLRRHEMIHSGNKPYKCEYCPKAFVEKQHLTCHVRIHTGEKPYSCSTCGKAFTQYGTLHKHLRTHNKNKPHKCQFCEKAYYERRQLTNHMLTHFENKGK